MPVDRAGTAYESPFAQSVAQRSRKVLATLPLVGPIHRLADCNTRFTGDVFFAAVDQRPALVGPVSDPLPAPGMRSTTMIAITAMPANSHGSHA